MSYPVNLPSPLLESYSTETPFNIVRTDFETAIKHRPISPKYTNMQASFYIDTKEKLYTLYDWYRNDLKGGALSFTATWEVEGIDDYAFEFRFTSGLSNAMLVKGQYKVTATLEILDDMNTIIATKLAELGN